jgi:hypothetical protein
VNGSDPLSMFGPTSTEIFPIQQNNEQNKHMKQRDELSRRK